MYNKKTKKSDRKDALEEIINKIIEDKKSDKQDIYLRYTLVVRLEQKRTIGNLNTIENA